MTETFKNYVERVRPLLDAAMDKALRAVLANSATEQQERLISALNAGKKVRGCLTCLIGEALGADLDSAVPRATALELIQAATLVHDDFVDGDTVRRNRPAVWTMEGARRAVLIGDVIFASAIRMMSDLGRDDAMAVSHAIAEVSRGALCEPLDPFRFATLVETGRVNGGTYETIIRLKTAILFGTACELGSISASGSRAMRRASFLYGSLIGEAYQIADDLQDLKQRVSQRWANQEQMTTLAPALLRFAPELVPQMPDLLRKKSVDLDDGLAERLAVALETMEDEIRCRLLAAVSEADGLFPSDRYRNLALAAPHDTVAALTNEFQF